MTCLLNIDPRMRKQDQRWFALHPFRAHRIRRASLQEIDTLRKHGECAEAFIIRQLKPGVRERKPISFTVPAKEALNPDNNPLVYEGQDFEKGEIVDQALSLAFDSESKSICWSQDLLKKALSIVRLGGSIQ